MDILSACKAVEATRGNSILVSTMGAMQAFDQLGAGQPRISSVPLMGGAGSLGLGLAKARPDQRVVVVDGDASLLMQLGVLATVSDNAPCNLFHFVVNNGTQFTGISNLAIPAKQSVDFPGLANAAGYRASYRFTGVEELERDLPAIFDSKGPVLIELVVIPGDEKPGLPTHFELPEAQFSRMGQEARALSQWLADNHNG